VSKENSIVYNRAFDFSVRIVKLYKYLCDEKREYDLARQILRSGTSIGANIREGIEGQSRRDFIAKLSISLKEAGETEYWLDLFEATEILEEKFVTSMISDVKVLIKMLNNILKTTKQTIN
jgi:four helix bundle protein